ncbi:hypothetical protein [Breznakia pachnodae]|uniref:ArpU family transcriptional regulator n=1 Tax=Breznakia pachnodae TaxID=265178 RepID=A0ABU0E3Y3_9FIRM|nr:hypothetical protein [Breznakia pachnodae]MDQ0361602.1 hypothetical protein [Breznakia pachnodae]
MICPFINKDETKKNIKKVLELSRSLFTELYAYELEDYQDSEVNLDYKFSDHLIVKFSTPYDDLVRKLVRAVDQLGPSQKRTIYYCYFRGISLPKLENGINDEGIHITSAYRQHNKAIEFLCFTIQELVQYNSDGRKEN